MPLIRIYVCRECGAAIRTPHGAPIPEHCGREAKWKQTRDFKPEEHGWATGEKSAAIGFRHTSPWVVPLEGTGPHGQLEVTSLRQVREIERESEKRERDGVGEALHFRAFSNDTKNGGMLKNTFGEPPQRAPVLVDSKGRQKISFEVVEGEPIEAMGPGADENLASALGPGMDL